MKLIATLTAGILATAPAQERVVTTHRTVVTTRHHVERHRGWNNHRVRRVCNVYYRHHQRIRRCRTVRY